MNLQDYLFLHTLAKNLWYRRGKIFTQVETTGRGGWASGGDGAACLVCERCGYINWFRAKQLIQELL